MRPILIGGAVAVGVGAALLLWKKKQSSKPVAAPAPVREAETAAKFDEHWSGATRVAVGLIGGGLMVYGMRSEGKVAKLAATTGVGLLTRSLKDEPIQNWAELMKPHLSLSA